MTAGGATQSCIRSIRARSPRIRGPGSVRTSGTLNLGSELVEIAGIVGSIEISSNRARDGEQVDGLTLMPFEGAIVQWRD